MKTLRLLMAGAIVTLAMAVTTHARPELRNTEVDFRSAELAQGSEDGEEAEPAGDERRERPEATVVRHGVGDGPGDGGRK